MYEVTVNKEWACPAALHAKHRAAGTCQGSCLNWVIHPDVHGLFDGSGDTLRFPMHYGEVFQFAEVSFSLEMVKDGRGGPEMLLISITKTPTRLPYVFHGTPWLVTSVSIDDCSFVTNAYLFLGFTNNSLIVLAPLKWPCIPLSCTSS